VRIDGGRPLRLPLVHRQFAHVAHLPVHAARVGLAVALPRHLRDRPRCFRVRAAGGNAGCHVLRKRPEAFRSARWRGRGGAGRPRVSADGAPQCFQAADCGPNSSFQRSGVSSSTRLAGCVSRLGHAGPPQFGQAGPPDGPRKSGRGRSARRRRGPRKGSQGGAGKSGPSVRASRSTLFAREAEVAASISGKRPGAFKPPPWPRVLRRSTLLA